MIPRPRGQGNISQLRWISVEEDSPAAPALSCRGGAHRPRWRERKALRDSAWTWTDAQAALLRIPRSGSLAAAPVRPGCKQRQHPHPPRLPFPLSCASPRSDKGKKPQAADRSTRRWTGSGRVKQRRRWRHNKRDPDRRGERERGGLVTWEDAPLHAPEARALAPFRPNLCNAVRNEGVKKTKAKFRPQFTLTAHTPLCFNGWGLKFKL